MGKAGVIFFTAARFPVIIAQMFRVFWVLQFCMIMVSAFALNAHALTLDNIRIGKHDERTRIVLDVDQAVDFKAFTLTNPNRIVVDLPKLSWRVPSDLSQDKGAIVTAIRHGDLLENTTRIVFEAKDTPDIMRSFTLPAGAGKNNRIVLDVRKALSSAAQPLRAEKTFAAKAPAPPKQIAKAVPPARKKVVVIDPGHGGQDPGATSGKTYEKHIVLGISRALKSQLETTGKYKVYLTRENDRFIKLHNRVKFARGKNADLFVSIHADSIKKKSVRGASIYTLSEKASDAQTAKLAARENKVDLIHGIDLTHEDHDVAGILLDLVQRDTMNQSNFFAEKLVKALKDQGVRTLQNPHRSAGFAVLKAPDIPSILIEAGFVSNRQDARLLQKKSYQTKLAKTIAQGIDEYLSQID